MSQLGKGPVGKKSVALLEFNPVDSASVLAFLLVLLKSQQEKSKCLPFFKVGEGNIFKQRRAWAEMGWQLM